MVIHGGGTRYGSKSKESRAFERAIACGQPLAFRAASIRRDQPLDEVFLRRLHSAFRTGLLESFDAQFDLTSKYFFGQVPSYLLRAVRAGVTSIVFVIRL